MFKVTILIYDCGNIQAHWPYIPNLINIHPTKNQPMRSVAKIQARFAKEMQLN